MAAPTPPSTPPPVSESAGKYLPAFERVMHEQGLWHILEIALVGLLAVIGIGFWQRHSAGLERQLAIAQQQRANAVTDAQRQTTAYVAAVKREFFARDSLTRQRKITDSLRLHPREFIFREPAVHDTVRAPPPLADSLPQPPSGIPLVTASAYDSLGQSCSRERHDCSAALASADTAIAHLTRLAGDRADEAKASNKIVLACERKDLRDKLIYGGVGIIGGFIVGEAHH